MDTKRTLSLLATLALLLPVVAAAMPACGPGRHCPMAGLDDGMPPCHTTSLQADDCCPADTRAEPVEAVPLTAAAEPPVAELAPTPRLMPARTVASATCDAASSAPLYQLFRALLI